MFTVVILAGVYIQPINFTEDATPPKLFAGQSKRDHFLSSFLGVTILFLEVSPSKKQHCFSQELIWPYRFLGRRVEIRNKSQSCSLTEASHKNTQLLLSFSPIFTFYLERFLVNLENGSQFEYPPILLSENSIHRWHLIRSN